MKKLFVGVSTLALAGVSAPALAQTQESTNEVIVTGTRTTGLRAADSPAPIEVVGNDALRRSGSPDLPTALAASVPSLNVQANGGDAAALTIQAALRGISPNDTLVLVNGKRRHTTADLGVDGGSPYSGSASVDLSFIPVSMIDHVEVLTDGAAAQYGTDAIAGVVNVILKNSATSGIASATAGQYYKGDGNTGAWSINHGFQIGEKGFINASVEEQYHDFSTSGRGDERFTTADGAILPGTNPVDAAGVPHAQNFPNYNRVNGDPAYNLYNLMYNAGYDLGGGFSLYSFGSAGYREASHYENYRKATKVSGVTSTGQTVYPIINGFDPREKFDETDYSFTAGVKGAVAGFGLDLSTTYGKDSDIVYTINSANAQLFPLLQAASATPIAAQRNFHDGAYVNDAWTTNLDVTRAFNVGLASPLNVAAGFEYRRESYEIQAGEPASYFQVGAQSFTGYAPSNAGSNSRDNYAFYLDLALDPIPALHTDLAGRYEHYSDFGETEVGKATARYDFNPQIAIRGTVSTGFRAPTLAEEYYSGTNVAPTFADVQLPPNSSASSLVGFSPLKPEISHNYSVGFVAHPIPKLQITADLYEIDIHDRILVSGGIYGFSSGFGATGLVSQNVLNAITARGITLDSGISSAEISIFTNAANTRTRGAELTATYASDFGKWGHVDWTVGANLNSTTIEEAFPLPGLVQNVAFGQTAILDNAALSALKTATPREKVILQAIWNIDKFTVDLRETIYGPTSEYGSYDGSGTATASGFINEKISTAAILDIDIGYKVTPELRLSVGAINAFNQFPPNVSGEDQGVVYNVPYGFSPYGTNGGYYYGRATYTF